MLVDASTVPATDLFHLEGSSTINLDSIGTHKISIRYEHELVSDEPASSVVFVVNSGGESFTHHETLAPYSLLGDKKRGRQFVGWRPAAGEYTLTVTVYAGNGALLQIFVSTLAIE